MENAIVQLNKYPKDKYNVLVPVTTMQVASNLQRITVSGGRARTSTTRSPAAPLPSPR